MKNWLLFILIFTSSVLNVSACGYYPYGEEVRFNLLTPQFLGLRGMDQFYYSSKLFSENVVETSQKIRVESDENIDLWFHYFNEKIDKETIYEAVYSLTEKEFKNKKHANKLIQLLNQPVYVDEYKYLIFAKKCAPFNGDYSDPWEIKAKTNTNKRKVQIKKALKAAYICKNKELQRRYAYLSIRMSFYNNDGAKIKDIYTAFFEKVDSMTAIDYWVLHFKLHFEESSARRNVDVARVFAHSLEKRFAVHFRYDSAFSIEQSLSKAVNDDERADLMLLYTSKKADRALESIKSFNTYAPNDSQLEFLILREVNKLEDWILTPHYTLFEPSLYADSYDASNKLMLQERLKSDRKYAKEIADWMNSIEHAPGLRNDWWLSIKNYVRFIANDKKGLLQDVSKNMSFATKNEKLTQFNTMLYSLVFFTSTSNSNLINETVQNSLVRESKLHNNQFMFAIGRELEFKGNTTDAALIYSKINQYYTETEGERTTNYSYWKTDNSYSTLSSDFFYDYFYYMDAQFTPEQVSAVILNIEKRNELTEFDQWKYAEIKHDLPKIYDLLGTKYVRQDKLESALFTFEKVNDSIWKSDNFPYKFYLGANPFYTNMFNEHKPTDGDTIKYTKVDIIRKLILYKAKIETETGDKKAYYNFQVANCYLNMSYFGNSWLMRRYYWSGYSGKTGLEDEEEYLQANMAKKYYLQAEKVATNEKFAALSLRMAGRCEEYRLMNLKNNDEFTENNRNSSPTENTYFAQLKNKYPAHYEPLISNCYSFQEYYKTLSPK